MHPFSLAVPAWYRSAAAAISSFRGLALIFDILPPRVAGVVRQRWYPGSRFHEAMCAVFLIFVGHMRVARAYRATLELPTVPHSERVTCTNRSGGSAGARCGPPMQSSHVDGIRMSRGCVAREQPRPKRETRSVWQVPPIGLRVRCLLGR